MPQRTFGTTIFDCPEICDQTSKVQIQTAEGSRIAVPFEDLCRFVAGAYVLPQVMSQLDQLDWRELLTMRAPAQKRRA